MSDPKSNEGPEVTADQSTPSTVLIAYNLLAIVLLASLAFALMDLFRSKQDQARKPSIGGLSSHRTVLLRRSSSSGLFLSNPDDQKRGSISRRLSMIPIVPEEKDAGTQLENISRRASGEGVIMEEIAPFRPRSHSITSCYNRSRSNEDKRRMSTTALLTPVHGVEQMDEVLDEIPDDMAKPRRIRVIRHR